MLPGFGGSKKPRFQKNRAAEKFAVGATEEGAIPAPQAFGRSAITPQRHYAAAPLRRSAIAPCHLIATSYLHLFRLFTAFYRLFHPICNRRATWDHLPPRTTRTRITCRQAARITCPTCRSPAHLPSTHPFSTFFPPTLGVSHFSTFFPPSMAPPFSHRARLCANS